MPRCVAYYGKRKVEFRYDTLTAAFEKANIEVKINGADVCEVYDKYNGMVGIVNNWDSEEEEAE